jgi:gag-polypeptide of LTR copia-type
MSIEAKDEFSAIERLTEDNWRCWSMRVKAVLEAKAWWGVVTGEDEDPDKVLKVRAALVKAVSDDFLQYVVSTHPKAAWTALTAAFTASEETRVGNLELQLQTCKKLSEETVFSYCNRVRKIVTEIQLVDPQGARQAVLCLLRGLPGSYEATRVFLLNQSPRPTLSACQAALMNADQVLLTEDGSEVALHVRGHHHRGGRSGGQGFRGRGGRHAGQTGGRGGRYGDQTGGRGFNGMQCHTCGEYGHLWRNCPYEDYSDGRGSTKQGRVPYAHGFAATVGWEGAPGF